MYTKYTAVDHIYSGRHFISMHLHICHLGIEIFCNLFIPGIQRIYSYQESI